MKVLSLASFGLDVCLVILKQKCAKLNHTITVKVSLCKTAFEGNAEEDLDIVQKGL